MPLIFLVCRHILSLILKPIFEPPNINPRRFEIFTQYFTPGEGLYSWNGIYSYPLGVLLPKRLRVVPSHEWFFSHTAPLRHLRKQNPPCSFTAYPRPVPCLFCKHISRVRVRFRILGASAVARARASTNPILRFKISAR